MILSDRDIRKYLQAGELDVLGSHPKYPFEASRQVQPCSIDLRLSNRFLRFRDEISEFDVKHIDETSNVMEEETIDDEGKIVLLPNSITFGQIYEQLRLPSNCCGYIEGRSRFARLGLSVHVTGGFINPEFEGAMPLQIVNNNFFPITIYPFMSICQLLLHEISSIPELPYPSRTDTPYHGELNASPSCLSKDPALGKHIAQKEISEASIALKEAIGNSNVEPAQAIEAIEVLDEIIQEAQKLPASRKYAVVRALITHLETFTQLDRKIEDMYKKYAHVLKSILPN